MGPGWKGVVGTDTPCELSGPAPQELLAVTKILPPLAPTVAVIEVVVELPVHPEGRDHVYEVAPDTGEML